MDAQYLLTYLLTYLSGRKYGDVRAICTDFTTSSPGYLRSDPWSPRLIALVYRSPWVTVLLFTPLYNMCPLGTGQWCIVACGWAVNEFCGRVFHINWRHWYWPITGLVSVANKSISTLTCRSINSRFAVWHSFVVNFRSLTIWNEIAMYSCQFDQKPVCWMQFCDQSSKPDIVETRWNSTGCHWRLCLCLQKNNLNAYVVNF